MKAIILAGGFGKRIKDVTKNEIPKPLLTVKGKSLLEYNIDLAIKSSVDEIIISVSHLHEKIKNEIPKLKKDVKISYHLDSQIVGDAGAFRECYRENLSEEVLFLNGDEIRIGLDIKKMIKFHNNSPSLVTVAVYKVQDPENYGIFRFKENLEAISFEMKPEKTKEGYANTGCYIMEKEVINLFPEGHCMMKDILWDWVRLNKISCYVFEGKYFNVGTPEILEKAKKEV